MHHPDDAPAGPAGLALPLALVAFLAERSAERPTERPTERNAERPTERNAERPTERKSDEASRVAELRTTGSRKRRAARRRATAVRG